MAQNTLLLIEATGVQDYIFGCNELKQIIGASELVQQATHDWVLEGLPDPKNAKPALGKPDDWQIDPPTLTGTWAAQVIYAGGGNAVVLFADAGEAQTFARKLSRKVLEHAPGLRIIITQQGFNPQQDVLKAALNELRTASAVRKRMPPPAAPLLGLGVTAACVYTGAPAVAFREQRWLSAEACAKQDAAKAGTRRLRSHLTDFRDLRYGFTEDFNKLGERGEANYMALIHTDGNNMGQRIEQHGDEFGTSADNEKYAQAQHEFSQTVKVVARQALNSTVGMLLENIQTDDQGHQSIAGKAPIVTGYDEQGHKIDLLPFRPIVFGGDDVTFACEGRIGLGVAVKYLRQFSAQILADTKPAHARAGVAVVKAHYPFARAYDLAEELCASAKKRIKALRPKDADVTALDWHFATSGLILPLKEIRAREYVVRPGDLCMRPVVLQADGADWRTWDKFSDATVAFQRDDKVWRGRRNKVKALREALRGGSETVRHFLAGEKLPEIYPDKGVRETGWLGDRCGYFDPVEALDFYQPLKGELA